MALELDVLLIFILPLPDPWGLGSNQAPPSAPVSAPGELGLLEEPVVGMATVPVLGSCLGLTALSITVPSRGGGLSVILFRVLFSSFSSANREILRDFYGKSISIY